MLILRKKCSCITRKGLSVSFGLIVGLDMRVEMHSEGSDFIYN